MLRNRSDPRTKPHQLRRSVIINHQRTTAVTVAENPLWRQGLRRRIEPIPEIAVVAAGKRVVCTPQGRAMRAAWHQPYDAIAGSPLPYQGRDLRDFGSTAIERYWLYILCSSRKPDQCNVIRCCQERHVAEAEIIELVAARSRSGDISRYAIPERVSFVDAIERTSVGKINKKKLRGLHDPVLGTGGR